MPVDTSSSTSAAAAASEALRQTLLARGFLVLAGREQDFLNLEAMLYSAYNPQGDLQLLIFKRILEASWNLQRCRDAEVALWQSTGNSSIDALLDDENEPRYARIQKYARQNDISLRRATEDLRQIQRRDKEALKEAARQAQPVTSPLAGHNQSSRPNPRFAAAPPPQKANAIDTEILRRNQPQQQQPQPPVNSSPTL